MQLRHAALTDVGRAREHNEDTYGLEAAADRPEGALFLVCDGAGGLAAGETASDMAVKRIISTYYASTERDRGAALRAAFVAANAEIYEQGKGQMGTTGVAAVFLNDALLLGNVGDSRALLIRDGKPRQVTRDHSFVAEQVAAGVITPEQAKVSTYRNIITRALGNRPDVEVDLFRMPLVVGDRVVLCSDGLHGQVEPEEIAQAVMLVPLQQAVDRLVALANDRGGPDNITVMAIEVVALTFAPGEAPDIAPTTRFTDQEPVKTLTAKAATASAPPAIASVTRQTPTAAVTPPLATSSSGGRSFVGWLFVAIALLALIGTLAYVAFSPPSTPAPSNSPTIPVLTPVGAPTGSAISTTASAPTLVPTIKAGTTSTP